MLALPLPLPLPLPPALSRSADCCGVLSESDVALAAAKYANVADPGVIERESRESGSSESREEAPVEVAEDAVAVEGDAETEGLGMAWSRGVEWTETGAGLLIDSIYC